jgi:hypothetical protein
VPKRGIRGRKKRFIMVEYCCVGGLALSGLSALAALAVLNCACFLSSVSV